jgi:hypothetical protein
MKRFTGLGASLAVAEREARGRPGEVEVVLAELAP